MAATHHTIAIYQVEQIIQGARRQGRDIDSLLRRSGISPVLLESPVSRVSQAQFGALMRVLRREMRDEFFGLCSHPVRIGTFAQVCRVLIHCRTLGEALRTGFWFYHGVLDDFTPRLRTSGGMAQVRLVARRREGRTSYAERMFLFFTFGVCSWLVARRIPLSGVDYREQVLVPHSILDRLFQAPVRFQQPELGLRFEARWLDLPVVQNAESLREFLAQAPGNLLVRYRDQTSVSERIRRLLHRHLTEELPPIEQIGKALAMSPQTLRRRLREEGQGYQAIKDDLRRDAAIEYLARPDLSLVEIAALVGFSEPSTFHRAFKKWTGVAPGEYRSTRLHEPGAGS